MPNPSISRADGILINPDQVVLIDPSTGLPYSGAKSTNPDVVTGDITAATAAPTTVAGLVANSFITIPAGTADSVTARVSSITGGAATATIGFYGSDDGVNLFAISGLPVGGAIGSGAFVQSAAAAGVWQLKGASERAVYLIATAIGAGATASVKLSGTRSPSRVTAVLRGSAGGSVSAAPGIDPTESVSVQSCAPKASTANIANGGSLSGAVDLGTMRPGRLSVPAAWTAAAMSFDVSADGATYGPLYDMYGSEVSIASTNVVASREILLDPTLFLSVRYIKIRSGLSGAVVAQGAARAVVITGV